MDALGFHGLRVAGQFAEAKRLKKLENRREMQSREGKGGKKYRKQAR